MKSCERCGNEVTDRYFRVCNVEGTLYSCPSCSPHGEVLKGPDEESSSRQFERNLEEIREGKRPAEIWHDG